MRADDPRHGTTRGHAAGCREACCREARNTDERRRRKQRQVLGIVRRIDGTGTRRRIQALWAIGWTSQHIADACGWGTPQAVTEVVKVRRDVYVTTAATIARVYEQMSMTLGPSVKNRRDAERKGWAPPLAWDDPDTDEHPHGIRTATPRDLLAEVSELEEVGEALPHIASRLGVTVNAIQQARRRARKGAVA